MVPQGLHHGRDRSLALESAPFPMGINFILLGTQPDRENEPRVYESFLIDIYINSEKDS